MDDNEMFDTIMRELNNQIISDTDGSEEQESFSFHEEAQVSDDIPPSLLCYYEASKSRAAVCEKLILEDLEDSPPSHHTEDMMNFPSELEEDMMKLNEQVICDEENNPSTDTCLLPSPKETEALFTDIVSECPNNNDEYLELEKQLALEYEAEREKRHCEEMKKEEQRRQRETDFQEELQKIMEAEKLHQKELELMGKRAQEKLEQELLLQQEVISNLQRRVEEERKMREEEQRRIKDEEDKRRREEEKHRIEVERRRMEEERKIEDMKRKKEEEEKRRMEREEKRKREEEQKKMKDEEDKRRREEEKTKMEAERKRMEEEMRRKKEEERKIQEMKIKEEENKREEEQRRMKEEEDKKKEEEKIKMESERRRMEERRKIEQMKLKKEEEEKRRIEGEEQRKREEEQRRMKDEEDKKKREEEEKLKVEAERKRMEEEMRRKKEEERQKEELERKNEEEEMRRMEMEEKKKMREEEQKRMKEEEKLKIEAQRKRMEEERKKEEMKRKNEEEEKRKREEERNKIILEKKKLEDEIRMMKEEEERMKKEEEERIKREEEEKRKKEEERNKIKEARKKMERKKRKLEEEMSLKKKEEEERNKKEEEIIRVEEETGKKSREKETLRKTHKEMKRRDEREHGDVDEEFKLEKKEVKEVVRTKEGENRITKEEPRPMEADERRKTVEERKTKEEERRRRQVEELRHEVEEGYRKSEEEIKLKERKEGYKGEKLETEEEKKRAQEEIRKSEGADKELKEEEVKENKNEVNKKTEEGGRLKEEESKTRMEQEKEVRVEDELQEKREESSLMGENKKKNKDKTENTSASQPEDGTTWTSSGSDPLHSESTTSPTSAKTRPPQCDPEEGISLTSTDQTVDCEENPAPSTVSVILPVCLPEHTERKRLSWMRDCVPWSKLSLRNRRKQKGSVRSRRGPRGAAEAGSLPPLCPDSLLQSTRWKSLQEVTTVTLEDLPGCNLSTLAQCTQLQSLTLRRCGLRSLDGIKQLPQLSYIDVQENDISFIDCENMTSLRVLHLSHNKLTFIHGLTGAENLDVLDLSYNSITRIAGLESVRRLQKLSVDHNQLINTKGLRDVYTLLHLNLSHNHLAGVEGLENSALLHTLDLRANSLTEPPTLNNQVLLRELHLDDNSISSLQGLTACWLPLMQNLSVAQNRITQLPSMSDSVSLANLDLRFNCMSEIQNACESLEGCQFLREVHLTGNPLQQERNWRSTLQKAVPSLRLIDGQQTDSSLAPPTVKQVSSASGSFLMFCQAQLQQTHDLQRRHSRELSDASSSLDAFKASCRHFSEALQLAEDQRFAHEYGEMTVTSSNPDMAPVSNNQDLDLQNTAAVVIQQLWRKYRQKCGNSSSSSTAEKGGGRGGDGGKPESGPSYINGSVVGKDYAATVIQAFWRGFTLRRRLASALAAVTCPDSGEDDTFEEVDVDKFVFDEAALEKQWTLSPSEDSPPRRYPVSEQPLSLKPPVHFSEPSQYILPPPAVWRPMQAWVSGEQVDSAERRVSPESSNRSKSPASASVLSGLSERSEKILEEWGFTDSNTALLMLKRAQKMKPAKQKRRRDPSVRLAMFRNCNYQLGPVEARNRPTQHNRNYIKVGEAEPGLHQAEKVERVKQERAQQWLHNQAAHSDRDSESEHFLPEISSDVLNGGRVQLVADPGYTERLHHARGLWANNSLAAQPRKENNYPRRNSLGRAREEVPSPQRVTSAPSKKERISFRDNPVQLSGGWGGGKKRDKVYK